MIDVPDRRSAAGVDDQTLIGRDDTLADLADRLKSNDRVAVTGTRSALAMHGHGGIGKTALAIEHCHTAAKDRGFDLIWWVNAENEGSTEDSFRRLLTACGVQIDPQVDVKDQVATLLVEQHSKWFTVFDNVPDKSALERWQPRVGDGTVLATTRSNENWTDDEGLAIDLIAPGPAKSWLLSAAGEPDKATRPEEHRAAVELVGYLDGLALALSMAAGFIKNTPVSLVGYRDAFIEDRGVSALSNKYSTQEGYDQTVYTALAVTRERLKTENKDAAILLLEYASFLAADNIPMYLFTPESLGVTSATDVLDAKKALVERSLIRPVGNDFFSVHRLLQDVTRFSIDHPTPRTQEDPIEQPVLPAAKAPETVEAPAVPDPPQIQVVVPQSKRPRLEIAAWIGGVIAAVVAVATLAITLTNDSNSGTEEDPAPPAREISTTSVPGSGG